MSSPNGPGYSTQLLGVTATTNSDAWAVGKSDPAGGGAYQALIERWDGSAWSIISGATDGHASGPAGVSATSASDAVAVGYLDGSPGLTEHWDGSSWSLR